MPAFPLAAANKGDAAIFPAAINKTQVQDALNRRISARNPDGGVATTGYDANNNVVQTIGRKPKGTQLFCILTNPRGTITRFVRDLRDRRTQRIEAYGTALQRTTASSYDAVGNLAAAANPLGVVTAFVYDALNRPTSRTDA